VLDFGRVIVGQAVVQISLPQTSRIEFNYGMTAEEALRTDAFPADPDAQPGDCFQRGLGPWMLRSAGRRTFRYLLVSVPADSLREGYVAIEQVWAEHRAYDADAHSASSRGAFYCSDPALNDLWRAAQHTLGLCMQQCYEASPRREGRLWIPAYRIGYLANTYALGDIALAQQSLRLIAATQRDDGALPAYALAQGVPGLPDGEQTWLQVNAGCDLLSALREFCLYSGDRETLEALWPTAERLVRYLCVDVRLPDLTAPRDCVTDRGPEGARDGWGSAGALAMHLVWGLSDALWIAEQLGQVETASLARQAVALYKSYLEAHHYSVGREAYTDAVDESDAASWHVNALAVLSGLAEGQEAHMLLARLISENTARRPCGAMARCWQVAALLAAQQRELALALLHAWQPDPHHRIPLEESGPIYLLSRYVLGATPTEPGWRRVLIRPQLGDLAWAQGSLPTPQGPIHLRWEQAPRLTGVVMLPDGVEGEALIAREGREVAIALRPGENILS
jgi:hypothetical protein